MGTRSLIAKKEKNGYFAIYCHWDGYPEGVGKTLMRHYTDAKKVDALLDLGDISSLGEEIGKKHNFDKRPAGQTNAYGRDRGETETEKSFEPTLKDLLKAANGRDCEYIYIFSKGKWRWRTV